MNIQVLFQFLHNFYSFYAKSGATSSVHRFLLPLQKQLLDDILMGNRNLDIRDFLLGEKAKILGLPADPHLRLLREIVAVDNNDHSPDTAIPEGRNSAGIIVYRKFFKFFFWNPQAQLFIGFPGNGLSAVFGFLAAAANQPPDIGIPTAPSTPSMQQAPWLPSSCLR